MSIVIAGATGQLGHLVVEALLERGVPPETILAGGRDLAKVADLSDRGVRTAVLDYHDAAGVEAALGAGDTFLLVSTAEVGTRLSAHVGAIDAAVRAGVGRIVYTSAPRADDTPLVLAPDHAATEVALRASGVPFTILRNGWYTENYADALEQARTSGAIVASVGDGRVSSASRSDFAAATAAVLVEAGHEGRVYELAGDVAWDYDELAAAFTEVLGREVAYHRVTSEQHLALLRGFGLDVATAGFVVALEANIRDGAIDATTGDLARLAGRPTTPLVEGLRRLV